MRGTLRVVTWNLLGRARPGLDAVADFLGSQDADLVVLQEVQRSQAARLAALIGSVAHRWAFKHWPVVSPAEGLAVLSAHPLGRVRTLALTRRWWWWHFSRRVAVVAEVVAPGGQGLVVVNVHLSPHGDEAARRAEVARLAALPALAVRHDLPAEPGRCPAPVVVAGDFNDDPDAGVFDALGRAGLVDAWPAAGTGPGATCWPPGVRSGPPTRRLDAVLATSDLVVRTASVPQDAGTVAALMVLSDHLPVTVTYGWPPAPAGAPAGPGGPRRPSPSRRPRRPRLGSRPCA